MRALSIRQPYAELILRGIKTVEYRSRATTIVGERFWIYASKQWAGNSGQLAVGGGQSKGKRRERKPVTWSSDLEVASPPAWLVELAEQVTLIDPRAELPRGVIVGSALIDRVERIEGGRIASGRTKEAQDSADAEGSTAIFGWHLAEIRRATTLRKPDRHPQPTWFNPF